MAEQSRKIHLNEKQTEMLFYISLVMIGLFVFLIIGSREPVLFDDSGSYMRIERIEGVMPVYPLFLLFNQYLFGNDKYLQIVIIEQAVLAVVSILIFVRVIKNKFVLRYWEAYLVFLLSLLPFTTEIPDSMATQQILTEGLAYALFYLFMTVLLQAVWTKKFTWLAGTFVMTMILALVRSQLQILFGVCGIVFLYLLWDRGGTTVKRLLGFLLGVAGCLLISAAGIWITAKATAGYDGLVRDNMTFNAFVMRIQDPRTYREFSQDESGESKGGKEIEEAIRTKQEEIYAAVPSISTSQYTSLIFSRGMYEADYEDIELFEDEMIRGLYEVLYEATDHEKQRYAYEHRGLWMWRDIVGGIGRVGKTCRSVGISYYQENYPEIYKADNFNSIWNRNLQTIGLELLRKHKGRFVYHAMMMLPQAFICTVFFQIEPIYLLCHLVTLFLYLSAVALMIWGYADKKTDKKCAEFMALVLGSNVVMVVIISLVFFGQQRYLVYNFGIFYAAYYILLRQLWTSHIHDWVTGFRPSENRV